MQLLSSNNKHQIGILANQSTIKSQITNEILRSAFYCLQLFPLYIKHQRWDLWLIAAHTDEKFTSADIGNAYIESKPDEDTPIFVEQPRATPELIENYPEDYV